MSGKLKQIKSEKVSLEMVENSLFKVSFMTSPLIPKVSRLRRERKCTGSDLSGAELSHILRLQVEEEMPFICSIKLLSQGVRIQWSFFQGGVTESSLHPLLPGAQGCWNPAGLLLPCQGALPESTKCDVNTFKANESFAGCGWSCAAFCSLSLGRAFPAGCFWRAWSRKQLLSLLSLQAEDLCLGLSLSACAWVSLHSAENIGFRIFF